MCGICGILEYSGDGVDIDVLRRMRDAMAYRGPDGAGAHVSVSDAAWREGHENRKVSVGLGHRRLAVMDPTDSGRQPMANEDGHILITYNGEIYGYEALGEQLRRSGHQFKSRADTEVLLHLYERDGTDAARALNGMFAFGIWDGRRRWLWLCRDRVGIKPLVYYADRRRLVFASELKSLLRHPEIPRRIDMDALRLYLAFGYVPAPYTIFKGVRKLPPAHSLIWEAGNIRLERYWDLPSDSSFKSEALKDLGTDRIMHRLRGAITEAVRGQMIADVPLGAFLSGGIDSSIIVALMARHSARPVKTFSIGYKGAALFDETRYARMVAERYCTDHREFILSPPDLTGVLPDVLDTFDEPFADSAAIPTYIVSQKTRAHVTVALSGDGGDELFAGYRSYMAPYWAGLYRRIPRPIRSLLIERPILALPDARDRRLPEYIRRAKKMLRAMGDAPDRAALSLKALMPAEVRSRILRHDAAHGRKSSETTSGIGSTGSTGSTGSNDPMDPALIWVRRFLNRFPDDPINDILYSDFADSLPGDMLTRVDWMSMRNSLEVRVPFLDHRVVELAFSIPGALKMRGGRIKYLLKRAFSDLLPPPLLRRPKAGFEVPISAWLRADLNHLIRDYLRPEKIARQGVFDPAVVTDLVNAHMSRKTDTAWMLWSLIVYGHWHDRYLDGRGE